MKHEAFPSDKTTNNTNFEFLAFGLSCFSRDISFFLGRRTINQSIINLTNFGFHPGSGGEVSIITLEAILGCKHKYRICCMYGSRHRRESEINDQQWMIDTTISNLLHMVFTFNQSIIVLPEAWGWRSCWWCWIRRGGRRWWEQEGGN